MAAATAWTLARGRLSEDVLQSWRARPGAVGANHGTGKTSNALAEIRG
jgi:hypothetical protein